MIQRNIKVTISLEKNVLWIVKEHCAIFIRIRTLYVGFTVRVRAKLMC